MSDDDFRAPYYANTDAKGHYYAGRVTDADGKFVADCATNDIAALIVVALNRCAEELGQ